MMASVEQREVLRCDHCSLVQFRTANALCRRCHKCLEVEEPEPAPAPLALVPTPAAVEGGLQVATAVRDLRHVRNLSQRQLAARMGVPRTYISKIENGKAMPTLSSLDRLATRPSGRHLHPAARRQHPPSRRDRRPHDRPLPRRDRRLHLAARRPAALHLPQPRPRARRRTPSHRLTSAPQTQPSARDDASPPSAFPRLSSVPSAAKLSSSTPCHSAASLLLCH